MRRLPEGHAYLHRLAPTPLVSVACDGGPAIWCKLEFLNPSGSTKDRIARYIMEKAWREGRISAGSAVVEASSGSTSIAMALACAQLGMRFIAVMPEGVSNERVLIIRAYGGEIRLTPKSGGIRGAIAETERLAAETGAFLPRQFSNPDNAAAHRYGTAREIIDQIPGGGVDAVVTGVGTGGTLVGLFQGFRDAGCQAAVPIAAKPVDLVEGCMGGVECCSFSARIPGVVDSVSTIFEPARLPGLETIEVPDADAIATTRQLIRLGFPVGPSSGLNYRAAQIAAERMRPGAQVVTVFPDRMERYFSTELFAI
jgi:cysteine synthase A